MTTLFASFLPKIPGEWLGSKWLGQQGFDWAGEVPAVARR